MKIFFSHSGKDNLFIKEIVKYLSPNIRPWIDQERLLIGDPLSFVLRNAIQEEVDFVVIFLRKEAIQSEWVQKELRWALERESSLRRTFLLPVLLENIENELNSILSKEEQQKLEGKKYLRCYSQENYEIEAFARELNRHLNQWARHSTGEAIIEKLYERKTQSESFFLEQIDFTSTTRICVFAHTGRRLIEALYNRIDDLETKEGTKLSQQNPDLEIRILLRNPYAENQNRYKQIYNTIEQIKRLRNEKQLKIDVRFYQTLPTIRAIICENSKAASRESFLSTYQYLPWIKSHAFDHFFRISDSLRSGMTDPFVRMIKEWFDYFWGIDDLHMVVFDFDDTLANTIDIQVDAWVRTIEAFTRSGKGKDFLAPKLVESLNEPTKLRSEVKDIFIDRQIARGIFESAFPHFPDTQKELLENFNEERFNLREKLTINNGRLFPNVETYLRKLHEKYHLSIISSTSEELIEHMLNKFGIRNLFSVILGKDGPKSKFDHIHDKANLLLKLSSLSGVPLERIVFVGDNNSDYLSAKQVNVKYIEARIVAQGLARGTLVDYEKGDSAPYFTSYENESLDGHLSEINMMISRDKYKLDRSCLAGANPEPIAKK